MAASFTVAQAQMGPLPVEVATPLTAEVTDWDEHTGRFEAVQRVEVRARVTGYLQEVHFTDGQTVEKNQLLFEIDPRPFLAVLAQRDAELKAALAEQTRADADLERGQDLVRNRTLPESQLDERRAAKLRADAQVGIAEAALRAAALDLEYTQVRAPFTGRISDARVDEGNLVVSGDTILAAIVSTDPIHLVFTSSEADFLKYARLNQTGAGPSAEGEPTTVQARLIDETGWPHEGRMDFINNELDPNAGTIRGRAIFSNADGLLTPGLFARLRLIASRPYQAVLIPDEAVLSDQARKIVLVIEDPDGTVGARVVTLGPIYRGMRVIRSGLSADDLVIVSGVMRAQPGGTVIPQETPLAFPVDAAD